MRSMRKVVAILMTLAAAVSAAKADSVTTGRITYAQVQITKVENCQITFRLASNRSVTKLVSEVTMIDIRDLPELGEAERLVASGKAAEAVAAYRKVEAADAPLGKSWMKNLLAHRKLAAAKKAGMILDATTAWLAIMDTNNASKAAIGLRPKAPTTKSNANDQAIKLLKAKEDIANKAYASTANQLQIALLNLQGRLEEAKKLASKMAGQLSGGHNDIATMLAAVTGFLKAGETDKAMKLLSPIVTRCGREDLPKVMLLLGKTQLILASKSTGEEKHKLLCEAGLNFVRVAAFFGSASEEASDALYWAGRVSESLAKPNIPAARAAYEEVIKRYKGTPAKEKAAKALAALKGK